MATTKKTEAVSKETTSKSKTTSSTKKNTTPKETIATEPSVEAVEEKQAEVKPAVKKTYSQTDLIPCKSVRYGLLQYISKKSGNGYEWSDYGDITSVEYGDLLSLKSSRSSFIMEPWFIIEDDQLVEDWGLTELYSYYKDYNNVESFLKSGAINIRKKLPNAPRGFKELVVYTAGNMVRNNTLDSIGTIRAIDDVLGKNLASLLS